ncbi:ClpP/crotonase [Serendipita vermifera]|nr:ClpP/crotonase [Serendipita vermifera]
MSTADVNQFLSDLRDSIHALENLDIPTIAAIDGPALGGGLELALACDLRVAGKRASKIGLPETKLGIIPGAGGTQRLARLLGISKAKELVFTGRTLAPEDAHRFGIVDYVCESGLSKAFELAEEMSSSAPLALRAAKLAISRAAELPLEAGLDFERACYQPLLFTKDRVEALAAFQAKRKPVFTGQ